MQLHQGLTQVGLAGRELIPVFRLNPDRLSFAQELFELFGFSAKQLVWAELFVLPNLHQFPWGEHPQAGGGRRPCALPERAHQASTPQSRQFLLQDSAL